MRGLFVRARPGIERPRASWSVTRQRPRCCDLAGGTAGRRGAGGTGGHRRVGVSRHPAESNVEMGGVPGESGPSPPLPCGVRPIWIVATGVVLGGMAAADCGGSQSASPTQRSTSATYVGADVAWLSSKAEPWNHKLNSDQYAVLAATNASSEDATSPSWRVSVRHVTKCPMTSERLRTSCTPPRQRSTRHGEECWRRPRCTHPTA